MGWPRALSPSKQKSASVGPPGTRKDGTGQETPAPAPHRPREAFVFILDAFVLFSLNSNPVESCLFSFTFLASLHLSSSLLPWPGSLRSMIFITFDDNQQLENADVPVPAKSLNSMGPKEGQGTSGQAPCAVDQCFCQLTGSEETLGKQTLQFCLEKANVGTSTDTGVSHLLTVC